MTTDWGLVAQQWVKIAAESIDPSFDSAWKREHPAVDRYVTLAWAWLGHANGLLNSAYKDPEYAREFQTSGSIAALGAKVDQYVKVLTEFTAMGFGMQSVAGAAWSGAVAGLGEGFENIKRLADKAGVAVESTVDAAKDVAGAAKKYSTGIMVALVASGLVLVGLVSVVYAKGR